MKYLIGGGQTEKSSPSFLRCNGVDACGGDGDVGDHVRRVADDGPAGASGEERGRAASRHRPHLRPRLLLRASASPRRRRLPRGSCTPPKP
jgi:hypothetical protein